MKALLLLSCMLFCSCANRQQDYRKAEDALDAGREYLQSCLQGDFSKAAFYLYPDEKNKQLLHELEKSYREKDNEGRQQLRLASLNINELKEIDQTHVLIHYSNSFDKLPHTLWVILQNNNWLVDLTNKSNTQN